MQCSQGFVAAFGDCETLADKLLLSISDRQLETEFSAKI